MIDWAELFWTAGILSIVAVFGVGKVDPIKQIRRMNVCVMRPDQSTITVEVWSDQLERYLYWYPGTTCGPCGKPRPCPKGTRYTGGSNSHQENQ